MNFNSLLFNPLNRMNEVVRYSSVHQESEETLSEHITEISMVSYMIARKINEMRGYQVFDIGVLLEKCLLHDAEEVLTGDIPRNTKYASSQAHKYLEEVASKAVSILEDSIGVKFFDVWKNSKRGPEGALVKISDLLVVVKKVLTEVDLRGNLAFLKVVVELESHLTCLSESIVQICRNNGLDDEEAIKLLSDLVKQATSEIVALRVRYEHVLSKYEISKSVIREE